MDLEKVGSAVTRLIVYLVVMVIVSGFLVLPVVASYAYLEEWIFEVSQWPFFFTGLVQNNGFGYIHLATVILMAWLFGSFVISHTVGRFAVGMVGHE